MQNRAYCFQANYLGQRQGLIQLTMLDDQEYADSVSPDRAIEILHRRAERLAKVVTRKTVTTTLGIVEFLLGDQSYAFVQEHLREVQPLRYVTKLPGVPVHILGVVNVRGEIVTVLDLKQVLGLPVGDLTVFNKAIIAQRDASCMAFLVDEVIGSRSVPIADVNEHPGKLAGNIPAYLTGVTKEGVILLDVYKIMSDDRLVVR